MSSLTLSRGSWLFLVGLVLVLLPTKAAAFGAGNIPSIAQVEGHNWRHGDIEDMLSTVAFLHGKKWSSMLIKRTYFGNWLRDYSQAVDVGSLKGVNAATVRILVWVLSFMSFGYATEEFEVTEERLGCYRPEEHIDNPLGYADGEDARKYDPRLRGPVAPVETEIDMKTGMKNYIANETGQWATSAGYLRFSFARSIHYGRLYTNGAQGKGKDENLCEALRCLGQALHCMEDFSAHSNYCELALRELGYHNVFAHCGNQAQINLHGKHVYPLVTGTFGAVDFLHSVIGEATDHFTQSEVDEVDVALKNAEGATRGGPGGGGGGDGTRGFLGVPTSPNDFISLVSKLPGVGDGMAAQASDLKARSDAQERVNETQPASSSSNKPSGGKPQNQNVIPGMSPNFDPVKVAGQIYPILEFRDKIVKTISRGISKVPGLEKLLEHISETLTAFILGLLAPFVRPIINSVSKVLKDGSSGVITASSQSQLAPWENSRCTDPTHSMLSKDHFTNILNPCAGRVASTVLQYAVPRILYAWENVDVPVEEVVNDLLRAFHHPALRNEHVEIQRDMFRTVKQWADQHPRRNQLDHLLGSESVKKGTNHVLNKQKGGGGGGGDGHHSHGAFDAFNQLGHGKVAGSLWNQVRTRDLDSMEGKDGNPEQGYLSPSPAPPVPEFDFGKNPDYMNYDSHQGTGQQQQPPQQYLQPGNPGPGSYSAPSPRPDQYYSGGYGGPPANQGQYPGYGSQPPYGGQGYGGPQGGQWGGGYPGGPPPPPPQGYGGPGYGEGQGGYGQYPPGPGQGQGQSWDQYPGSGYQHQRY